MDEPENPYVEERKTLKKTVSFEGNPTDPTAKDPEETKSYYKTLAIVFTVFIVILIIYYSISCFAANQPKKGFKSKKTKEEISKDDFNVEEEVEKLRKKQDNYKSLM